MDEALIIGRAFNGPRLSGNGGYVGGLMAERFNRHFATDGAVEITLRAPIPIETPLQVVPTEDALLLKDGEMLVCEARAGSVAHLSPPPPPTDWNDVMRRGEVGGAPDDGEFSRCIVCGRERAVGDGLRVWAPPGRKPAIRCPAMCRIPTMPTRRAASGRSSSGARSTVPARSPPRIPMIFAPR